MTEEEYVYKPEEIIFAVMSGDDHDFNDIVVFTTKKCWQETHACSDELGGHNMPGKTLLECGVEEVEMAEAHFELTGEFDLETVTARLIGAGFTFDSEFNKFINNPGNAED